MRLLFIYLLIIIGITGCILNAEFDTHSSQKINGVSLVASRWLIESADLVSIKNIDASWVTLMPYAFIQEGATALRYDSERQWGGERPDGISKDIELCKLAGLKIMLKPHVWISHGMYTGDFEPVIGQVDETAWKELEKSYGNYILDFARIAEKQKVELFCIGTEWRTFIKERPAFWTSLILKIRKVYSGKLTYASNWDEYKETPFWNQLDYIGINAYFPLTEAINPSAEELQLAWFTIISGLEEICTAYNKQIIYTEYGYRSAEGATIRPWESETQPPKSMEEQKLALQALYNANWNQPWFAGGFLWKWFNNHTQQGGKEHIGYTPQNKPAESVIKERYGKSK